MKHMSRPERTSTAQRVVAHRERRRAAGRQVMTIDLPGDLVEAIDQIKEERGFRGRTPVLEEALRAYVIAEREQAAKVASS